MGNYPPNNYPPVNGLEYQARVQGVCGPNVFYEASLTVLWRFLVGFGFGVCCQPSSMENTRHSWGLVLAKACGSMV